MKITRTFAAGAVSLAALIAATSAFADCGIEGKGSVRILSNDFEALRIVNDVALSCATADVTVTANATAEHKNIQGPALTVNPAEYTVAVVANNSIVPLLNDDLIRPLDDLVAKYGASLQPNQLIKIDGKVMAIAFMGNGQHLFYRKDILEKAGVAEPKSYEDVLAAAKAIKDAGLMETPLAASVKPGWDLAAEFVNAYLGTGGVMATCGAIGIFSGFNFSSLGRWLMFALLGLIVVGIVGIFVPFSQGVNIVYSLIGMAVFAGFFLFDFFRAKDAPNTWESAIMVTMQSYLNFINSLLYLLRFLEAVFGKRR